MNEPFDPADDAVEHAKEKASRSIPVTNIVTAGMLGAGAIALMSILGTKAPQKPV